MEVFFPEVFEEVLDEEEEEEECCEEEAFGVNRCGESCSESALDLGVWQCSLASSLTSMTESRFKRLPGFFPEIALVRWALFEPCLTAWLELGVHSLLLSLAASYVKLS